MEMKQLPSRALLLWEGFAVLGYILLLLAVFFFLSAFTFFWWLCVVLLNGVYLAAAVYYLPSFYGRTGYSIDEEKIILKSGVFFRRERILFLRQLSSVSVMHTPIDALLGIAFLRCSVPGSRVTIPFLLTEEALQLQRELLGGGSE